MLYMKDPKNSTKKSPRYHKNSAKYQENQYTKISSVSIHQQWTVWERNQENNAIHSSLKKIKTPMNKFNEGSESENYKSLKKKNQWGH
jgi:hypothetical protein